MKNSVSDERSFIHDASGVLSTAALHGDTSLTALQRLPHIDPDIALNLVKLNQALEKLMTLFADRRNELIRQEAEKV